MTRRTLTKVADLAFFGCFAAYAALAVLWLFAGLLPALAHAIPAFRSGLEEWARGGDWLADLARQTVIASRLPVEAFRATGAMPEPGLEAG